MCRTEAATFACEPASVREARAWVHNMLDALYRDLDPDATDDVGLAVSELVTNCVRADAHELTVTITAHRRELVIAATDDAVGVPTLMSPDQHAAGGRGLRIVEALTSDWGVSADDPSAGRKTVWAKFAIAEGPTSGFGCTIAS